MTAPALSTQSSFSCSYYGTDVRIYVSLFLSKSVSSIKDGEKSGGAGLTVNVISFVHVEQNAMLPYS